MKHYKHVFPSLLLAAMLAIGLGACSRETPRDYLATIYPASGTTTAELNPDFRWAGLQDANYRFRLGTAGMETVLIDTTVQAMHYRPELALQGDYNYTWEISRAGEVLTVPFKTPSYQQVLAGDYSGVIREYYYYDSTTVTEWQGMLQVTVDGLGLRIEISEGYMSARKLYFESLIGSTVRFSFGNGSHHDSAWLEVDLLGTEVAFYSIYGSLTTNKTYTFYRP
jgi:hypothetical protein